MQLFAVVSVMDLQLFAVISMLNLQLFVMFCGANIQLFAIIKTLMMKLIFQVSQAQLKYNKCKAENR